MLVNPVATILKQSNKLTNEQLNDKIQALPDEQKQHVLELILAERPPSKFDLKYLEEVGLLTPNQTNG